jgi:hypothetical protein
MEIIRHDRISVRLRMDDAEDRIETPANSHDGRLTDLKVLHQTLEK